MKTSIRFNHTIVAPLMSAIAIATAILPLPTLAIANESTPGKSPNQAHPIQLAQWINPDTGSSSTGLYQNEYFDFSIAFPTDWAIASQETRDHVMDLGTDIISSNNPELGQLAANSLVNTYQLLLVSEVPLATPGLAFNPNFIVMAERVSTAPHIVSGSDYLIEHTALLAQTELPYEMIGNIYPVALGGRDFYRSDYTLGNTIRQSYIFTIDQGYALGFILSGLPEQFQSLEDIVQGTEFGDS